MGVNAGMSQRHANFSPGSTQGQGEDGGAATPDGQDSESSATLVTLPKPKSLECGHAKNMDPKNRDADKRHPLLGPSQHEA